MTVLRWSFDTLRLLQHSIFIYEKIFSKSCDTRTVTCIDSKYERCILCFSEDRQQHEMLKNCERNFLLQYLHYRLTTRKINVAYYVCQWTFAVEHFKYGVLPQQDFLALTSPVGKTNGTFSAAVLVSVDCIRTEQGKTSIPPPLFIRIRTFSLCTFNSSLVMIACVLDFIWSLKRVYLFKIINCLMWRRRAVLYDHLFCCCST